jgi:non-canonical (house-cleaning) NTP pyrophosphatase
LLINTKLGTNHILNLRYGVYNAHEILNEKINDQELGDTLPLYCDTYNVFRYGGRVTQFTFHKVSILLNITQSIRLMLVNTLHSLLQCK